MKKYILILVSGLLFSSNIYAGERYLTGGVNVSRFYDVGSKPLLGFSLGLGKEWLLGERSGIKFGISYFERGAELKSKTIHPYPGTIVNVFNLFCRIGYLSFPFSYQYFYTNNKKLRIYSNVGVSPGLALFDGTENKLLSWWSDSHFPEEKADYFYNTDPGFLYEAASSTIDIALGTGVKYRKIAIEGQIRIDALGDVNTLKGIDAINTKFLSFMLLGFYYF